MNEAQRELNRLRAALPKDAYGVALVPGMEVTGRWDGPGVVESITASGIVYVRQPGGVFARSGGEMVAKHESD